MKLKCKKCGSRNTFILTREQLSKAMDKPKSALGTAGIIADPAYIIRMVLAVVSLASKVLEKEKNKVEYVLCEDCGYYEKL